MNHLYFGAVLSYCMFATAYAQDKLPVELTGVGVIASSTTVFPWSVVIESQEADGAIKGKMNWSGRACNFKNLPFSGTYREGMLKLSAPETSPACGVWTIEMKRTSASEFTFDGTATTSRAPVAASVNLKPR